MRRHFRWCFMLLVLCFLCVFGGYSYGVNCQTKCKGVEFAIISGDVANIKDYCWAVTEPDTADFVKFCNVHSKKHGYLLTPGKQFATSKKADGGTCPDPKADGVAGTMHFVYYLKICDLNANIYPQESKQAKNKKATNGGPCKYTICDPGA